MMRTAGTSRRQLFVLGSLALAGGLVGCSDPDDRLQAIPTDDGEAVPAGSAAEQPEPGEAWVRLAVGNDRFAGGKAKHPRQGLERRKTLAAGQRPFACVLGCVDSRVPPEMVFDQGLGDLLTVRSVGEVLDDAVVGSIEYAVAQLETPLVVVMGHTDCGAVKAAIDLVREGQQARGKMREVVRSIKFAVRATKRGPDPDTFVARCAAEQADRVVNELRKRSKIVRRAVKQEKVRLVPVTYNVRTGYVATTSTLRN